MPILKKMVVIIETGHKSLRGPNMVVALLISPGQNGRHFANEIFQMHYREWKVLYLIKISLKFVPEVPIDNNPALV